MFLTSTVTSASSHASPHTQNLVTLLDNFRHSSYFPYTPNKNNNKNKYQNQNIDLSSLDKALIMPMYSPFTKTTESTALRSTVAAAAATIAKCGGGISKFYTHQHHRRPSSSSPRKRRRRKANRLDFNDGVLAILDAKEILADLMCDIQLNDGLYDVDEREWMGEWRALMGIRERESNVMRVYEVEDCNDDDGDKRGGIEQLGIVEEDDDDERLGLLFERANSKEWVESPDTTTACTSPSSPALANCVMIDASSDDWDLVSTSGVSESSEMWELLSDNGDLSEV